LDRESPKITVFQIEVIVMSEKEEIETREEESEENEVEVETAEETSESIEEMEEEKAPSVAVEEEIEEAEGIDVEEDVTKAEAEEEDEIQEVEEEIEEEVEEEIEEVEEEEYYEDAVNKGDFIRLELTGRVEETDEVFDTTDEELAQEEGIHQEGRSYGPRLVVVGEGWVLRGLDNRLPGLEEEEEVEIEIPSEDAFGQRDPDNVQMVPYRILRSKGVNPVIGQELEIDGRSAIIRSIGAGRVQVDYNHPLAGRKIIYNVRVTEILEDEEEKIRALIGRRFLGIEPEEFQLENMENKYTIEIPEQIFFSENIQIAKRGLALELLRFFPDLEEIDFLERIERS
jgi:FKBP-type peptidyl-prolyl cis-trans isomerase 2